MTALLITLLLLVSGPATLQTPRARSPIVDQTRPHPRIPQTDAAGRRPDLKSLKGARLFTSPGINPNKPVPLLIHFHGAPWLIETHIARYLPKAALITVQLGSGSSAYRRPFEQKELFRGLLNEAAQALSIKRGWSSVTLTGFSAGYGGVREILRRPEYFAMVNNVLLLDGMHTSYAERGPQPGGPGDAAPLEWQKGSPGVQAEVRLLTDGGTIQASDIDIFVSFAREAYARRKTFVVTHSEIFPGTYASTTECADYLLAQLSLKRRPKPANGPMGMQQLSAVDAGGLHLRGYAGNTAPDHIDFLHAMPAWFGLLRVK